jgi:hypothetical protein
VKVDQSFEHFLKETEENGFGHQLSVILCNHLGQFGASDELLYDYAAIFGVFERLDEIGVALVGAEKFHSRDFSMEERRAPFALVALCH